MMPLRSGWKLWGYRWFEFFADIFDFAEYRSSGGFSVQSSGCTIEFGPSIPVYEQFIRLVLDPQGARVGVTQTFTGWRGVLQRNAIAVHQKKINRSRLFARNRQPHETPLHTIDCRASLFGIAVGPCRCGVILGLTETSTGISYSLSGSLKSSTLGTAISSSQSTSGLVSSINPSEGSVLALGDSANYDVYSVNVLGAAASHGSGER